MKLFLSRKQIDHLEKYYFKGPKPDYIIESKKIPIEENNMLTIFCVDNLNTGRRLVSEMDASPKKFDKMKLEVKVNNQTFRSLHRHNIDQMHGVNPDEVRFHFIPNDRELGLSRDRTRWKKGKIFVYDKVIYDWKQQKEG